MRLNDNQILQIKYRLSNSKLVVLLQPEFNNLNIQVTNIQCITSLLSDLLIQTLVKNTNEFYDDPNQLSSNLNSYLSVIISSSLQGNKFDNKEFLNVLLLNNSNFNSFYLENQKEIINSIVKSIISYMDKFIIPIILSGSFYWGASTSAYQIEGYLTKGGQGVSQWDPWSKIPGNIVDGSTANVACNSYLQTDDLINLLLKTGCNSYRFSIAWTRIFPLGKGKINQEGVEHYNRLINKLLANNITPFVTLYHWDLPVALSKEYFGWLCENGEIWADFANYADFCFKTYGDRVKNWITINEPQTISVDCYEYNYQAPGLGNSEGRAPLGWDYKVGNNLLLAHAYAVRVYREKYSYQKGTIGIVCNMDWGEPYTQKQEDKDAAERRNVFWGGWFYDPIFFGNYPQIMIDLVGSRLPKLSQEQQKLIQGSIDVFYLNNYSAEYIYNQHQVIPGWNYDQQNAQSYTNEDGELIGAETAASWLHVVPYAPKKVLLWFQNRYSFAGPGTGIGIMKNGKMEKLDIMITEQGMPVLGEDESTSYEVAKTDTSRIQYYASYLSQIAEAIQIGGLQFKGYFTWSIIDNWEWGNGFTQRFGINYLQNTDKENLKLYLPKNSALWYKNYIHDHPNGPTS